MNLSYIDVVVIVIKMSIVRHLVKLNEKKEKDVENVSPNESNRERNEKGTVAAVPRTENPLHDMKYTETCLGLIDFKRVQAATGSVVLNKRGRYQKYSDAERYKIGKYDSEMGATAAVKRFKKDFPTLNESTFREMKNY